MGAEDKKKTSFAREVGWWRLKKALKLLFARRLEAEIVEMQFIASTWPPEFPSLMMVYRESTSLLEQCCSLRWREDQSCVQAESWLDLASTLEAGAREGKSFSVDQKTVFGPGDSIESALVEADLLGK